MSASVATAGTQATPAPASGAPAVPAELDFESESFSAASWVNSLLSGASFAPHLSRGTSGESGGLSTEEVISAQHDELQRAATDAHAALDGALAKATSAVPWAVREAEKVRQRAAALRAGVDGVGERVAGVEGAVSAAVAAIADADTLVRRVDGAAGLLRQAAAADALLARLDSLLASSSADGSDLVSAADVVAELRAALEPLRDIGDLADRFEQLNTADQKLESLAEPHLRVALDTRNGAAASNARIVFDRAGRNNAFAIKYVDIRASEIADMWKSSWAVDSDDADGTADAENSPEDMGDRSTVAGAASETVSGSGRAIPATGGISAHPQLAQHRQLARMTTPLDLSSTRAALKLDAFFTELVDFLRVESDWLAVAFPDLRDHLLPLLLTAALAEPAAPSLARLRPDPAATSASGVTRLHHASLRSARAAADVARVLRSVAPASRESPDEGIPRGAGASPRMTPDPVNNGATEEGAGPETLSRREQAQDSDKERLEDLSVRVFEAVSSVLFPCRAFWSLWPALAARAGENAAQGIAMNPSGTSVDGGKTTALPLVDIAKIVESSASPLMNMLDALSTQIGDWTGGIGVVAVPAATNSASSVFSRRVLGLISRDQSMQAKPNSGDDWARVGGALRLLRAVSHLKQSWELRKETAVGIAANSASSLLEIGTALAGQPDACVARLLEWADAGMWSEASAVLALVQDNTLGPRVVNTIQRLGEKSSDFQGLLDGVQRVVYKSLIEGVRRRFRTFEKEKVWGAEDDDDEESIAGFSSSPLVYATEIADYLMTVPQQLEPYVPNEEDDVGYGTPMSIFAFSKRARNTARTSSTDLASAEGKLQAAEAPPSFDAAATDGVSASFAGMWIGALAIGTMELYMEKVLTIPRLTAVGARQLGTDVEYVCNVLAALGVTPTSEVELLRRLLSPDIDRSAVESILESDGITKEEGNFVEAMASMRGLRVSK